MKRFFTTKWIDAIFPASEFEDEEYVRGVRLLAVILRVILFFDVLIVSLPIFMPSDSLFRDYVIAVPAAFVFFGLTVLLRHRCVRLTGVLLSFVLWAAVTANAWTAGGLHASNPYFLVIIIASVLLGGEGALVFGLLSLLAMSALFVGHQQGIVAPNFPRVAFSSYLITTITFMIAMVLLHYATGSIARALARARHGERALAERVRDIAVFKAMVDNSVDGIAMLDLDGMFVYVNTACARLFGDGGRQEMLGLPLTSYLSPDQHQRFEREIIPEITRLGEWRGEFQIHRDDGSSFLAHITCSLVRDEAVTPMEIAVVFRDITELRAAEMALKSSAERLAIQHEIDHAILMAQSTEEIVRVALQHLQDVIPCLVSSVLIFDWDAGLAHTIGLYARGQRVPELELDVGLDNFDLAVLKQGRIIFIPDMPAVADTSDALRFLYDHGMRAYINMPLLAQQKLIGVLNLGAETEGFFTDEHIEIAREVGASLAISVYQAQLSEQIQQEAIRREALLHEVNHRVGNNLMSIVGLLHTERRFAPPKVKEDGGIVEIMLDRLIQRVNGLAEVHKMLSGSSWSPVRLSDLVKRLIRVALSALPRDQRVTMQVVSADITVSPRQANNLALVINELATNTIKYAMIDRQRGQITVTIALEGDLICLEYRDDGPGYPDTVLHQGQFDVGLYLIHRFITTTLHGELSLFNDHGAVAQMRFPLEA